MPGSIRSTSPTNPRSPLSLVAGRARMSAPSSPDSPAAFTPATCSWATISLFTLPMSTIFTSSMVGSSVTRRPSTKFTSRPSRSEYDEMSGPPPCTTTGFMPTNLSSAMSRAKDAFSSGFVMAAPPYLMTTVAPANSRMYGRASSSTAARACTSARSGRLVRLVSPIGAAV